MRVSRWLVGLLAAVAVSVPVAIAADTPPATRLRPRPMA
jgi:hypothetical protein